MLDFRIQTFLTVCDTMSFTAAAERLNITQPAVTQHIHYLEERYRCRLFLRDGKRLSLTHAGCLLRDAMETIRNDELRLTAEMQANPAEELRLNFGVTMTIGEYTILNPVTSYLRKHPNLDLHIRYANTQTLLEELRLGKIDFAVIEGYIHGSQFETRTYQTVNFIPVCAAAHQFTTDVHSLQDLFPERLLLRESGSGTRAILENVLTLKGHSISEFNHLVQIENMHSIVELLKADCGISFLYEPAVKEEIKNGILKQIPLNDFNVTHDFTLVWNRGSIYDTRITDIYSELFGEAADF